MLKGKELGAAIEEAIRLKIESGACSSKADIARHFDIKPPSIYDWINKGSISKDKLPGLWRYFSDVVGPEHWGLDSKDLYYSDVKPIENVTPITLEKHRYVPLIAKVPAGNWLEIFDDFAPGCGMEEALAPISSGKNTFGLVVEGDSMEPKFHAGDVLIVDPDRSPKGGDYVIARNHLFEATFKRFRSRGFTDDTKSIERIELVPENDKYPTLTYDSDKVEIIGVVIQHQRTF